MSGGGVCLLVLDAPGATKSERMFAGALRERGFDVRVAVVPSRKRSLAVAIRRWVEGRMIRRGGDAAEPLSSLGPVDLLDAAGRLSALIGSLQPRIVFHFADPSLAPAGSFDLYQIWLNGQPESLRMEGVLAAKVRVPLALTVTAKRRGWPAPRVIARADLTHSGAWAVVEQMFVARRGVAMLLRAIDAPEEAGGVERRPMLTPFGALREGVGAVARGVAASAVRRWVREDAWFLGYRRKSETEFRILYGGRERFLADPFAVSAGGEEWVFYEDYNYASRRGVISLSRLLPDGTLSAPSPVLERPYHLSYPCVFQFDGAWWMVPETAGNGTVELYRAVDFPFQWTYESTLLDGIIAVDATLHHDGRWWMFASLGEFGASTWDELSIFMADELTGPWRPHRKNPVKRNPASSRPAGRLLRRDGRLIRPAQDCSRMYGGAVRFCNVECLTEDEFRESEAELLPPSIIPGAVALHTWAESENIEVVDARLTRAWLDPARFHRQIESLKKKR